MWDTETNLTHSFKRLKSTRQLRGNGTFKDRNISRTIQSKDFKHEILTFQYEA